MMGNFPFFRNPYFPSNYYRYYSSRPTNIKNVASASSNNNISIESDASKENGDFTKENKQTRTNKNTSKYNSIFPFSFNFSSLSDSSEPLLEVLGLSLYLDDIIILGLLFLLYKENVKDEMLFICLIMLLLS